MTRPGVLTVIGTRPELVKLSRVIARLDEVTDHTLVHTGQNYDYELNQVFFEELEIRKPDYFLKAAGKTPCETVGNVVVRTDAVLAKVRPDALLVLGDTNSCLAAYSAKRRKIPVFHMEAGNRCFDERVPEEMNRRILDHISDINMPYSRIAREYLLREGIPPDRVIKTGSPMFEVLHHYMEKIDASDVLQRLRLKEQDYFVVSSHREENIDDDRQFDGLLGILKGLAGSEGKRVIVSTHPRTRQKLASRGVKLPAKVELLRPLGFLDYVKLQKHALAVLSDSGTITEESSILNFPALNLREAHERPEGMEEGAVMMVGMNWTRVQQGLEVLASQNRGTSPTLRLVSDYDVPNVSDKVLRILLSYTDYVNRGTWHLE
ncbi:UDP-N-acetylglucosamine 2-epimerase (non-hydrolyzing) [candidate division WOR-3 bacterium]|uniref:UDP-N-acetylglucosamine 2-epimerase (Non-hydrolyzing) n=1 Tax=candidate division WOR-3 bacterium TaxID=2052148 RepID=A0A937XE99_UNCW3|nr:UDP-N-acetylglucosamine 2-epimerase (non-hydrolyzing) [candidate division WOR-3 bacterium]